MIQGKAAAVAVAKVAAAVAVAKVAAEVAKAAADKAVAVAEVGKVAQVVVVDNKDVLESGTSAVRGSQVKMAGLPKLTSHRGPFPNLMPQLAS